jgi:hypothetical protein
MVVDYGRYLQSQNIPVDKIDEWVKELRDQRHGMVQTLEQYAWCYFALGVCLWPPRCVSLLSEALNGRLDKARHIWEAFFNPVDMRSPLLTRCKPYPNPTEDRWHGA